MDLRVKSGELRYQLDVVIITAFILGLENYN